jgi:hypothetical protein
MQGADFVELFVDIFCGEIMVYFFHTTFVFSKAPLLLLLLEPTLSLVRVLPLDARLNLVRVVATDLVWNPDSDIRLQLE